VKTKPLRRSKQNIFYSKAVKKQKCGTRGGEKKGTTARCRDSHRPLANLEGSKKEESFPFSGWGSGYRKRGKGRRSRKRGKRRNRLNVAILTKVLENIPFPRGVPSKEVQKRVGDGSRGKTTVQRKKSSCRTGTSASKDVEVLALGKRVFT